MNNLSFLSFFSPSYPDLVHQGVARTVALQTLILTLLAISFKQPLLLSFVVFEFLVRTLYGPRFSLVSRIAKTFQPLLFASDDKKLTGSPKRFAQFAGLLFSASAGIAWLLTGQFTWPFYLLAVLTIFSALEAIVGWCAACFVFNYLMKIGLVPESVCVKCAKLEYESRA